MKIYLKYFLFIYILAISGFEYFHRIHLSATYLLFPVVLLIFYFNRLKFDRKVIYIIVAFFGAFTLQSILFNSPWIYAVTLVIRLLTLYYVAKIIGTDFPKIFINVIKYISYIAIVCYILENIAFFHNLMIDISSHFTNLGSDPEGVKDKPNFIIYALQTDYDFSYIRNAGPFWEPGVFVIFLNIALFLNMYIEKKILITTNLLFIVCIITSFSTLGYIGLIANFTFYILASKEINIIARFFLITILTISVPLISSLPFMKEKIDDQMSQTDISYSRFGAILVHWKIIQDYPITGLPYDKDTYSEYSDTISPNGITEIFMRYGIFVGLLYYILLYKASVFLVNLLGYKNKGYMLFLLLLILIFSENMGNRPIYFVILFLSHVKSIINIPKQINSKFNNPLNKTINI